MLSEQIRVSGFRAVKVLSKKEKQEREGSWNPRFYVERMPQYDATRDRHLQSILPTLKQKKLIVTSKSKKVRVRSPKLLVNSNSSKKLPQSTIYASRVQTQTKLKQEIENAYITKGIPIEYLKILNATIENLEIKYSIWILSKHLHELQIDRDSLQEALKAVKIRERYIQEVEELSSQENIDRKAAIENISNLAIYSIQAIEAIGLWKSEIAGFNPKMHKQKFLYHGESYLLKMTKDLQFLKDSKISVLLGEKNFEGFIPNICEKKFRNFSRRIVEAESRLFDELNPSAKESLFELRNKKKVDNVEKRVGEGEIESVAENSLEIKDAAGSILADIQEYAKNVPEQVKKCLGDPNLVYGNSLKLKFPAYFWVQRGKLRVGLFVLNLENQKTLQKRLFLSHISATDLDLLEKVIGIAVEYCKLNYPCDEIRVALSSPQNAEGKYESDKAIKQFFDKLGFRWKVLTKDWTEIPVHMLGLSITKQESAPNPTIFQDSMLIVYSCTGQSTVSKTTSSDSYCAVGLASILSNIEFNGEGASKSVTSILSKIATGWKPPLFRISQEKDLKSVKENTEKLGLHLSDLENKETWVALSSIELNWVKFLTTSWNDINYIYIHECEIDVMESKTALVYIIPTEDPNFKVFLIPTTEQIDNSLERSKEILSEIFEVKEKITEIWIPEFSLTGHSQINLDSDKSAVTCQENIHLHIKAALHTLGNVKLVPKPESLVIKGNFLFGLINSKIDEEFEVPYVAAYVQNSSI